MTTLATAADVWARLGRAFTPVEEQRVGALLTDASAAVRAFTGQRISQEETTFTVEPERGRVRLMQRPVNSVSDVTDVDSNPLDFTLYNVADPYIILTNSGSGGSAWTFERDFAAGPFPVVVTYDHGYDTIPDDIVAVTCGVVLRALGRTPLESGVMQQSVAGYSETIGPVGAAGPVGFLPEEKAILTRYRRAGRVLAGGW